VWLLQSRGITSSAASFITDPHPPGQAEAETKKKDVEEEGGEDSMSFKGMVDDLTPVVPANITVAFYFMSILHLANEKGLELTGQDDLCDFSIQHMEALA
jgi:hypothetical protein